MTDESVCPTGRSPTGALFCYSWNMDFNRFTEKLQEAVRAAQGKAVRSGNQQIDVAHLLAALVEQEGGLASSVLTRAGVNMEALGKKLTGDLERLPKVSGGATGIVTSCD